jgi:hypothetical protein
MVNILLNYGDCESAIMIYEESVASSFCVQYGEGGNEWGLDSGLVGLISGPRPGLRHNIRASQALFFS